MEKILVTLGVIVASLGVGYGVQRLVLGGRLRLSGELDVLRRRIQSVAQFGLMPLSAMLSIWGLPAPDTHLLALPLLGACSWVAGAGLGVLAARLLRLDGAQTGSMLCCGSLTNIGGVGSLVCVVFLGEQAIALAALYRMCEDIFFFGMICPAARYYAATGPRGSEGFRPGRIVRQLLHDKVLRLILGALLLGVALNAAQAPRFPGAGVMASACMLAATVLLLVGIGMGLRLARLHKYTRQWMAMAVIKFLLLPGLMVSLALLLGFAHVDGGLPLRVVLVVSAMPVAMNALIPPSLFGLDLDLANACWVWSTAALIVVVPVLALLLRWV